MFGTDANSSGGPASLRACRTERVTGCAHSIAPVAVLAFLAFVGLVSGVASPAAALDFFKKADQDELVIADPLSYTVSFEAVNVSDEEAAALRNATNLVADTDLPVSGSLGLLTKAGADRDGLVGKLYELARYGGIVDIRIAGRPIDQIAPTEDFGEGPVKVSIRIDGGQVFHFGKVAVRGEAAGMISGVSGMVSGAPAYSTAILEEQNRLVFELKAAGHPFAEIGDSIIEADHRNARLDVTLVVHAGPRADLGTASVSGAESVDAEFIREQAAINAGQPYSPEVLAAAQKRLRELEVFETVEVREGEALDENGQVPVEISVTERKHRYFGVGATYSNAEGAGVEGYWGHRNLFGRAEKLRIEGGVSRIGEADDLGGLNYSTAILFEKPAIYGPKNTFTANVRAVSENTDAFERRSARGGFGIRHEIDKRQTLSAALDLDWSRITESGQETNHLIFSTPLEYAYDGSDDRLDPREGFRFSALLEPATDLAGSATFVKGRVTASAYFTPPDSDFVTLAARGSVGSIIGADLMSIPADRRFYAGGGGSIRGFAYQSVGPRNAAGDLTGGRSVVEGALEARLKVTETLGVVPFLDFGNVSRSSSPDFGNMRFGAGVGIRYVTPFGPLRLDVGVPLDRRKGEDRWAIYAGIGQAF